MLKVMCISGRQNKYEGTVHNFSKQDKNWRKICRQIRDDKKTEITIFDEKTICIKYNHYSDWEDKINISQVDMKIIREAKKFYFSGFNVVLIKDKFQDFYFEGYLIIV